MRVGAKTMSNIYKITASGSADNSDYVDGIAKIIQSYFADFSKGNCMEVGVRDVNGELLFETGTDGNFFSAHKDVFSTLFKTFTNVDSKDIEEEKSLNAKPLTEKEKELFGNFSITKDGHCYCVGDFVRATSGGACYHLGDVGVVTAVGHEPGDKYERGLLCVLFADPIAAKWDWVPCENFEVVPRSATKEEKISEETSSRKYLTDKEKETFGKLYTGTVGTSYHAGDFVRAIAYGEHYHPGSVGIITGTDAFDSANPILVYIADNDSEYWSPCEDFEKVYWS